MYPHFNPASEVEPTDDGVVVVGTFDKCENRGEKRLNNVKNVVKVLTG